MKFRFTKEQRLKGYNKFHLILTEGKKFSNNFYLISVLKRNCAVSQIGISVSKKIKRSVDRNKLKRQLREIYRKNQYKFNKNLNIVVIAKEKALNTDLKEMEKYFMLLCERAGIIIKE